MNSLHLNAPRKHLFLDKQQWILLTILLFFGSVYACISLVNHALFRTHASDLTYYNQAIYQFSLFRFGSYTMSDVSFWHTFGDHFEPILMLIAPLRYLFGQVTLLLVQIGGILFGALGLYRYVHARTDRKWLPHIAAVYFLSFWGIYSATGFDFHASVLGAMFVPWLMHAFERKQWKWAVVWGLLFLMCGEKLALWGIFIGLGLAWLHRRDRELMRSGLLMAGISLLWFVLAVKFIIPLFLKPGESYRHFHFTQFGDAYGEVFVNLLKHPADTFLAFFSNHLPDNPYGNHLKWEFHKMVLFSGGLILLWRPQYLLMLLPVYAWKMLNDATDVWGINMHYSIEVVPIISLAFFAWLCTLRSARWQYGLAILVAALTLTTTLISFSSRYKEHSNRPTYDISYPAHWSRSTYNLPDIRTALALIPPDVAVTASETLTPHLSMREKVYLFPKVADAAYAVLMRREDLYPMNLESQTVKIAAMEADPQWETLAAYADLIVFRRVGFGGE